jgi:hypothetical protein
MHATSPGGLMIIVPVGILFTCLLSFRMLWLMHFVSIVVSGILPQAGASLFGGLWAGFVFECSGRSVEGGLHHAVSGVVERIFSRF